MDTKVCMEAIPKEEFYSPKALLSFAHIRLGACGACW